MTLTFDVGIDFDADGTYTDVTDDVRADTGITIERGRDQIRQLAPPMAARAGFELDNQSKDYSPEYASGLYYGDLLPGRKARIRANDGSVRPLLIGFTEEPVVHPDRDKRSVSFTCLGPLSRLRAREESQKISTALYENIRTDEALGYILDAVGWAAGDRVLDTGKTTLRYWWLDKADAFQAAVEILSTEGPGAALYEDTQGRIVFESRHYRLLTARCTASQATISDTGAEPLHSSPFSYDRGYSGIVNECTVKVITRQVEALQKIWALEQTVTLAPNESRKFPARGNDIFKAAVCTAGTDYTVSAGSLSSATLDRTSGASCTITLTAGASGATVTGLQLRATPVTVLSATEIANTISTSTSQTRYGKRSYSLPVRGEIALNTLQDFCNAVVGVYQEPRPTVELTLRGGDGSARVTQLLTREISDRVTLVEAQSAVNHDYHVERVRLAAQAGSKFLEGSFGCEKADTVTYFILNTSTLDGGDVLGF